MRQGRFPAYGWFGVALALGAWVLNWTLPGMRTHLLFLPQWLGYCLSVDALVWLRTGSSLLARSRRRYLGLFIVSAPAWWLFEAINLRTMNWEYLGRSEFTRAEYFLLASLSFSTVIPAVFGTAELLRTTAWMGRLRRTRPVLGGATIPPIMFLGGCATLGLLLLWPSYFFPFVWISGWLIVEPINFRRGYRSLLEPLRRGDWRAPVSLALGSVVCGFFWEMWNYLSYPKWVYHVPFVGFMHVFEMPLLGYGGYVPFALELFALYHLVVGLLGDSGRDYLRL